MSEPLPEPASHEQFETLRRTRDELRLQVHLGMQEVREEWDSAEVLWARLQGEVHRLGENSKQPSKKLGAAAGALVHEVGIAYGRIRAALQRPTDA